MSKKKKKMRRENGAGTVYMLSGNRRRPWVAAKTVGWDTGEDDEIKGVQKRKIIGYYETEDEAMLALLTYKEKPHVTIVDEKTTVKELFKMLFKDAEKEGLSKSSIDILKASYRAIESLKNESLYSLTSMDFQFIIDSLIEDPNAKSSFSKLNKIKSLVSKMYDILIMHKVMNVNHAKFISLRGVKEGEVPPFPEKDIQTLFNNDKDRIAKSSLILAYTGLRISEFLELRKFLNVDLKRWLIVGGNKTEAGKDRAIAIHPYIQKYVEYFFNEFPESEYLFSRNGEKVTADYYRRYYHNPLIERLKLSNLNPHSFRHTAASKMKMAGMDDKAITDMIGHVSIDFTNKRYVEVDDKFLHEQMKKVK
ncbi:MAG: site-specific integrase [Gottschalkiaceae bacterium]|nr:MAG: site-specific integrase [Gottschalkiaceae bacterium]